MFEQSGCERDQPHLCLTDFVAPLDGGKPKDYIGMFACTAGLGAEALCAKFEAESDDYNSIMVKALADRCAEALAECLHRRIRVELWGYSKEETLSHDDILSIKYRGIRPAPGYPTQPYLKRILWRLLGECKEAQIGLTDSLAMTPAASVSALCFSHSNSQYFAVGKINKDQVEDYSSRKNQSIEETERWLAPILGYEND
ncbi:unnamed protein product, partial [Mesorhabditis belari]|uniref:AdoMet activation domain-containing protein n=1 Tax=Mesorhabditis belari TaxID=2138241 RepID=A0AAF3J3D1_9BILA